MIRVMVHERLPIRDNHGAVVVAAVGAAEVATEDAADVAAEGATEGAADTAVIGGGTGATVGGGITPGLQTKLVNCAIFASHGSR